MPTNSPADIDGLIPRFILRTSNHDPGSASEQQLDMMSQVQNAFEYQPYSTPGPRKVQTLQIWTLLLVVICLGSFGSFSLVPYMLPGIVPSRTTQTQQSSSSQGTPIAGPFKESECTAQPADMNYLPTSAGQTDNKLPSAWLQAGRSQQDLAYAQACAASFIIAYQTFNANDAKTFETGTYMLTDGATQRFYGTARGTKPDRHMDPMWRASIQQQNVQQVAQCGQPLLLQARNVNGRLLVWMLVPYQLSISIAEDQPVNEDMQITVLLMNVPVNEQGTGTGWQVSQWQEGNVLFNPPALL